MWVSDGIFGNHPLIGERQVNRLEGMTILLAAVDCGSLSAASRQLGLPLATVSRRVAELEDHLKIRLLLRGSRKLDAHQFRAQLRGVMPADPRRHIRCRTHRSGRVSVVPWRIDHQRVAISMGRVHVMPVVEEFMRAFPDVRMRVLLNDRRVDLIEEDVELAFRVGHLADSSMIALRVGHFRRVVCAGPAYLDARGVPKKPADLASHDCVVYDRAIIPGSGGSVWEFGAKATFEKVSIRFRRAVRFGRSRRECCSCRGWHCQDALISRRPFR